MGRRRRRRWVVLLAVLLVAPGVLAAGCWLGFGPDIPFNAVVWQGLGTTHGMGLPSSDDNQRARMVDDLLRHHLKVGMRWSDAKRLLGDSDAGGDGHYYYDLRLGGWTPRPDQEAVCLLRWRTTWPELEVVIAPEYGPGPAKVVSARIVR